MKRLCKATFVVIVMLVVGVTGRGGYGLTLEQIEREVPPSLVDGVVIYIYGYPLMMFGVTGRDGDDPASANWNAVGIPSVQGHQACLNNDGSLDLYLQATEPPKGSKQFCNWLPTPANAGYIAFLRMYWPDEAILDKEWIPPPIVAH